jgi:hypothetical protein
MAIAGVGGSSNRAMLVAAPSPIYAVHMATEAKDIVVLASGAPAPDPERDALLVAGALCAAAWAIIGLGLLAVARARTKTRRNAERLQREALEASFTAPSASGS